MEAYRLVEDDFSVCRGIRTQGRDPATDACLRFGNHDKQRYYECMFFSRISPPLRGNDMIIRDMSVQAVPGGDGLVIAAPNSIASEFYYLMFIQNSPYVNARYEKGANIVFRHDGSFLLQLRKEFSFEVELFEDKRIITHENLPR